MVAPSPQARPRPLDVIPERDWAPGRADAWWWLGVPAAILAGVLVVHYVSPDFYRAHVLPEGFGFLELTQFVLAALASVLCFHALGFRVVRGSRLLWWAVVFFALAALYIAGEEHSWGQHFFNWSTPAYWSELNRQAETNLHNFSHWFNHRPRLVLEISIAIGGILIPLVQSRAGLFRQPMLALLTPPVQLTVVAVVALLVKVINHLRKGDVVGDELLIRPSEALETFIYLFLLYYVIVLGRRLRALETAGVPKVPL